MKKLLAISLLLNSCQIFCATAEENVQFILEQTHLQNFTKALDNMQTQCYYIQGLTEDQRKDISKISQKYINGLMLFMKQNSKAITAIYSKYLTDAQIEKLAQFYKSDLGKKLTTQNAAVSVELMQLMQPKLLEMTQKMQQELASGKTESTAADLTELSTPLTKSENNILWIFDQIFTKSVKDGIFEMIASSQENLPADTKKMVAAIIEKTFRDLAEWTKGNICKISAIYCKHFTEQEIENLVAFYKDEVGQLLIKNMGPMAADIVQMLQPKLVELSTQLQQEIAVLLPANPACAEQELTIE